MSYQGFEEDPRVSNLTGSRLLPPPPPQDQYGTIMLDQSTYGNTIPMSGTLPIDTAPPPTAPRALQPPTAGRPLSPPATQQYGTQFGTNFTSVPQDLYGSQPGFVPTTMPPQGGLRQLDRSRVMTVDNLPEASSAPPAVFTTTAIPQIRAQESTATLDTGAVYTQVDPQEENEYLRQHVEELEYQLHQSRQRSQPQDDNSQLAYLEQRLQQSQANEAAALQQQEQRLYEINELQRQMDTMRRYGQTQNQAGDQQRIAELQREVEAARAQQAEYARQIREQQMQLQEQSRAIEQSRSLARSQNFQVGTQSMQPQQSAALRQQAELAQQKSAELDDVRQTSARNKQEYENKIRDLKAAEDNYQKQLQEERKKSSELQAKLDSESKAKETNADENDSKSKQISHLQDEVSYLQKVQTFHEKQSGAHKKEVERLRRLREEDAPPPKPQRMPYKALEERVMHLACFTMFGLCALPILGALALLNDENYVFWLGKTWPWLIIGGCLAVLLIFTCVMHQLLDKAQPEHRGQFTMAFTMATFTAFLGIVLVPMALMANKDGMQISGTISQGCLTAYSRSEMLVDYSAVLYNIRGTQNCTGKRTVEECNGYAANKFTTYLQYLEGEFQCGPLCPESPPPASAVHAPTIWNNNPTVQPPMPAPHMWGPPLQNSLGEKGAAAFLQAGDGLIGHEVKLHEQKASRELVQQPAGGVMETALPHMQARKLFAYGTTRATCYPLIATRLQVLVSTFGGLWYYQGIGLIIVSLLMSIYSGMYFAMHLQ